MGNYSFADSKLAKNSLSGIIRVLVSTPLLFLIVPFMIKELGSKLYGIWALGSIVLSYASLGDLGLSVAVVKYTAQFAYQDQKEEINKLANTTAAIFLAIGFSMTLLLWLSLNWFVSSILKIESMFVNDAKLVLIGFAIIFIINLITGVFGAILDGVQRMDLSNFVKTISVILTLAGIYISLSFGFGIRGMLVSSLLVDVIVLLLSFILAKRVFLPLAVHYRYISMDTLKSILNYSLQIQSASLLTLLFDPLSRVLITNISGVMFLPFYDIANRVSNQVRLVFISAVSPLMPFLSGTSASDFDREKIAAVHKRSIYYLCLFGYIAFGLSILFIGPFVQLWLGNEYSLVAFTFRSISVGWFASLIATPAFAIFRGIGLPRYTVYTQAILVIVNVFLGLILGSKYGFEGIIVSISVSLILASLYLLVKISKITNSGIKAFPLQDMFIFLIAASLFSPFSLYMYQVCPWHNYFTLGGVASLGGFLYFVSLWVTGQIRKSDFLFLLEFSFVRALRSRYLIKNI